MTLLDALTHEDASTRLQAALAFGSNPDPAFVDVLISRCAVEPDFFVRDTLTWALTRLDNAVTVPKLARELASQFGRGSRDVQRSLSRALVALGEEAVEPVLRHAKSSTNPIVVAHARATERLLHDPHASFELAVNEAARTIALRDGSD